MWLNYKTLRFYSRFMHFGFRYGNLVDSYVCHCFGMFNVMIECDNSIGLRLFHKFIKPINYVELTHKKCNSIFI